MTENGAAVRFPEGIWGIRVLPSGETRISLHQQFGITYDAGETTDTLRQMTFDGTFTATIPHVVPTNDVDFWHDGDLSVAFSIGPTTLVNEDDPTQTLPFSLQASWTHPPIARLLGSPGSRIH